MRLPCLSISPAYGVLAHTINILGAPVRRFLVVKSADAKPAVVREVLGIRNPNSWVFEPRFSPSGRKILFKVGDQFSSRGIYHPYVWDLQTDRVTPASIDGLTYSKVEWSPDEKYLAYVKDGDTAGNPIQDEKLRLAIFDIGRGTEKIVVADNGVQNGFAWGLPVTLYFNRLPVNSQGTVTFRPDLYAIAPDDKSERLVARDAYRPVPSPDGKQIAFFGSETLKATTPLSLRAWTVYSRGSAISVMHADGTNRKILHRQQDKFPEIRWLGEQDLISLQRFQPSPNARAQIAKINIASGTLEPLRVLSATDFKPLEGLDTQPQFKIVGVENSGRVTISSYEFTGRGNYPFLKSSSSLQSIGALKGGFVKTLLNDVELGFDWIAEAEPLEPR